MTIAAGLTGLKKRKGINKKKKAYTRIIHAADASAT
jgi:hypothetical protein